MATIMREFKWLAYLDRPDEASTSDLWKGTEFQAETAWRRRVAGMSPFSD